MTRRVKGPKPKHVPKRTCIACRQTGGKRGMIRLVRTEDGVKIDPSGKLPGRGAYLHPNKDCWTQALEGHGIQKALRTKLSVENRQELVDYIQTLPPMPETDVIMPGAELTDFGSADVNSGDAD